MRLLALMLLVACGRGPRTYADTCFEGARVACLQREACGLTTFDACLLEHPVERCCGRACDVLVMDEAKADRCLAAAASQSCGSIAADESPPCE